MAGQGWARGGAETQNSNTDRVTALFNAYRVIEAGHIGVGDIICRYMVVFNDSWLDLSMNVHQYRQIKQIHS